MVRLLFVPAMLAAAAAPSKPNIVFFLTDDQDQMLGGSFPNIGGVTPMPQTKVQMEAKGAMATNFFIHTPICCPSRAETLSGRYFHNIKMAPTTPPLPTYKYPNCMHINETKVNNATFAKYLKEDGGYTVGCFGKYLNTVPKYVAEGFDAWMVNGGGDYIAPKFSTHGMGWHGMADGNWQGSVDNYTTAVVGNASVAWIRKVVAEEPTRPFFAYVAPKAAHEPFQPAPWYEEHWDAAWPATEPRDAPAWNCSAASRADKHGNIATQPMLSDEAAVVIAGVFKNRWRTLMSVDDVIGAVIDEVEALGLTDNTYFFYTSDHGFQLGQFNIIMDKRNVYDWDTRIHLLARGPGIAAGSTWSQPATQVDLAPTFLGIAGLAKPAQMDGKSLLPLLTAAAPSAGAAAAAAAPLHPATARHLAALGPADKYAAGWRDAAFIEYYFVDPNVKCVANCTIPSTAKFHTHDRDCTDLVNDKACWGGNICNQDCYATEGVENNFIALRTGTGAGTGVLYAEFQTGDAASVELPFTSPDFVEMYDTANDEWEMKNVAKTAPADQVADLHARVQQFYHCAGDSCL